LQTLLQNHAEKFSADLIQKTLGQAHSGIPKAEDSVKLACPACSSPMNALNYDYSSGIIVHTCSRGDGIWFDQDELEEVEIFMDHWNNKEAAEKAALKQKLADAKTEVDHELDEEDAEVKKKLGPASRVLDSIFYAFEKLSR
jgi:Zn-finger nucleic acid-binding protein